MIFQHADASRAQLMPQVTWIPELSQRMLRNISRHFQGWKLFVGVESLVSHETEQGGKWSIREGRKKDTTIIYWVRPLVHLAQYCPTHSPGLQAGFLNTKDPHCVIPCIPWWLSTKALTRPDSAYFFKSCEIRYVQGNVCTCTNKAGRRTRKHLHRH